MDQNLDDVMSYKQQHYQIIENFLEKDFIDFIQDYFSIKINSESYDKNSEYFSYGYSFYNDFLIATIQQNCCEFIFDVTEEKVNPVSSLTNMYMKGDEYLITNESCEISVILSLGISSDIDKLPLYFSSSNNKNNVNELYISPGDICIFDAQKLHFWRNQIENKWALESHLNFNKE